MIILFGIFLLTLLVITALAIVCHIWVASLIQEIFIVWKSKETPVAIGNRPRIVVTAVSRTGLRRVQPAAIMASRKGMPLV